MTGMNEKKLKIEYVEASALKPNPKNPRKNEEAVGKLVKSIGVMGWRLTRCIAM